MEYVIYTFGNGEILKGVFDAIAMCLNAHSGSLYVPLIRISLIIGALWAAIYAIYADHVRTITSWILPMTAIMQLLFVPQVKIMIVDPVSRYHGAVDHVPYGLAMTASYVSRFGQVMTEQIEKVFVLPDDLKYQKTGTLFASELIQQARTFRITNQDLNANMREFVGQCVIYDVLLGKYSLEELRNSANIWELVSTNPSPVRSFLWQDLHQADQPSTPPKIVSCREGIRLFNTQWHAEIDRSASYFGSRIFGKNPLISHKAELLKHLPLAYSTLTDLAKSAQELLQQQMMIYAVVDGIEHKSVALGNPTNFAVQRAYLQQRTSYETLGAMAAYALPTMKAVLEAIAYATFLFVIPLSILPFGWKFLSSWLQILVWLQMWAPLYAVLNYIMTMAAKSKSLAALAVSNEAGITIANSVGLVNINADLAAMSGYLAMSIPFLCIALVKGVGSFVGLATHLGSVTQGVASQVANDAVSGNYSFGNVGMGNNQIANTSMLNQSYSASLRTGSFQQSNGRTDLVTSADGQQVLNIGMSNLPISIQAAEQKSAQLSQHASQSYQNAQSLSQSSQQSLASSYRSMMDLSKQLGHNEHFANSVSSNNHIEQTTAINHAAQQLENFSKENNLSQQQTADLMAGVTMGASIGMLRTPCTIGLDGNVGFKIGGHAYDQEVYNKALRLTKSEDFQHSMRDAVQASKSLSHSIADDQSRRLVDSVSGSYEQANHFRNEASKSYRNAQDFQQQAAYTAANSTSINANYTQEFVQWLIHQKSDNAQGSIGMYGAEHILANEHALRDNYIHRFLNEKGLLAKVDKNIASYASEADPLLSNYNNITIGNTVSRSPLEQIQTQATTELNWDPAKNQQLRNFIEATQQTNQNNITAQQTLIEKAHLQGQADLINREKEAVLAHASSGMQQHLTHSPIGRWLGHLQQKGSEPIKQE